jgi:hypothetical protein
VQVSYPFRVYATGPRGIRIEGISLNGRSTLRVTMRGVLIGHGHYTTVHEALAALARYGIGPDEIEFDDEDCE